jgi:hypothetical protein
MFRASLRPSSGCQTAFYYLWFSVLFIVAGKQHPRHSAHISPPDSPALQLKTGQKTIGSKTQSDLLTMGVKTPETC